MVKSEDIKNNLFNGVKKCKEKYADIINLPHHVSAKHPQMSMEERAAQFAPFAALVGYGDVVKKVEKTINENVK